MTTIDHDTGLVVSDDHALVPLSEVETFLATRPPVETAKELRDRLAALCAYYKGKVEDYNEVMEGKLRTERYIGQALDERKRPHNNQYTQGDIVSPSTLDELGFGGEKGKKEAQRLQQLASVPEEQFNGYIAARKDAAERIVKNDLLSVVSGLEPRRTPANLTSASNEWYTPSEYVEAARDVMDYIDLDPASNLTAQDAIQATHWYGLDHPDPERRNGLTVPWGGRVWLNPPYGADAGESSSGVWAARLIEQHDAGLVTEAVLLVNAVTDRKWFQQLWRFPICFTDHRIKFYTPDGTPQQPVNGNALVYLGDRVAKFIQVFSRFGVVVGRLQVYDGVVYAEVEDAGAR